MSNSYISSKGYVVFKKDNETLVEKIKKDLLVEPIVCPGYGDDTPKSFKIYKENENKLYIPVHYGLKKVGPIEKELKFNISKIDLEFKGGLREYQRVIVNTYLDHIKDKHISGGIISVGCGRGKTVMGLKIAQEIGLKTLILVHKEFLMNQWIERMEQFLPDAKIGVIQGKTIDVRNKDIVIGMVQSLSNPTKDKDYTPEMFEEFGLLIADECHHLSAKQFSRALRKHTYKYTLGLSATPNRDDGLTKVFKHYLGDILYKDNQIKKSEAELKLEHIPDAKVDIIYYNNKNPDYKKELLNYKKKPNVKKMESNICEYTPRTTVILKILKQILKEKDRNILILTARREHVFEMEEEIIQKNMADGSVGVYLGGMKEDDLKESETKRIIIGTYNMAEEAFDCKKLNTLIFASPIKKIAQAVGRILRIKKDERKVIPLVIDICDNFSSFSKWNGLRETYYKSKKYEIDYYKYEVENKVDGSEKNMKSSNKYCDLNMIKYNSVKLEDYKKGRKKVNNNSSGVRVKKTEFKCVM